MSGGVQAAIGSIAAASLNFSITTGEVGVGDFGYISTGPIGTLTPDTLKTRTIAQLYSDNSLYDLAVLILGPSLPQTFWTTVLVETSTANQFRIYQSASATFSTDGTVAFWRFGTGSSMVWTAAGQTRRVIFFV